MTAATDLYPLAVADALPLPQPATPEPPAPLAAVRPERRLLVVDYHLRGPEVRVPSRAADELAGHLHGWLYHLQGQEPTERRPCDPEQQTAPFGSWLLGDSHPSRRPGQVSVRVCWYGEEEAHRSIASLASNPTALLGCQPYALSGISPVTRQPVTAATLLEREEDAKTVRISTISEVTFRRHTRWHCSLDGRTVVGSALSRWSALWPGTIPTPACEPGWSDRIIVSGCDMQSGMTTRAKVTTAALRGWVEWDLYGLDSQPRRRLVMALLRGAEIYGLGSRCAYGLGAVRVEVVR